MSDSAVLIVGGGLAGLACAYTLHDRGIPFRLFEAQPRLGGRVQTDAVDGFLLNRGFHFFLTSYPEVKHFLDLEALDLHPFYEGTMIRFDGRFHRLADAFRHPLEAPGTILSPIGTFRDKIKVAQTRAKLISEPLEDLFAREELPTHVALTERWGYSERIVERFFKPFFGGIFLDPDLETSSAAFEFTFRMLAQGQITLPAEGMQAIPEQLAAALPPEHLHTGARVAKLTGTSVTTEDGSTARGTAVVLATPVQTTNTLLNAQEYPLDSCDTTCLYYAAPTPPIEEPLLILNGDGGGTINSVTVPSTVSDTYAPRGRTLVCVSLIDQADAPEQAVNAEVRRQLFEWFGNDVAHWEHLRTYQIRHALPRQTPPRLQPRHEHAHTSPGVYVCHDYLDLVSLNGALAAGRRAAEAVIADLDGDAGKG